MGNFRKKYVGAVRISFHFVFLMSLLGAFQACVFLKTSSRLQGSTSALRVPTCAKKTAEYASDPSYKSGRVPNISKKLVRSFASPREDVPFKKFRESELKFPTEKSASFGLMYSPIPTSTTHYPHEGVDLVGNAGSPIYALARGRVVFIFDGCRDDAEREFDKYCGDWWGNHVLVEHLSENGVVLLSRYAHLGRGSVSVSIGETVLAGQRLGSLGNSGLSDLPHLHIELGVMNSRKFENACAPVSFDKVFNPEPFLKRALGRSLD